MNKAKWLACRSVPRLVIKLAEETGEVAQAHLNASEASTEENRLKHKLHLLEELEHVRFISQCLSELVTSGMAQEVEAV